MFISQLYEGSISDKQIVQRSGFLAILDKKVMVNEIKKGDAIMADKGFDIQNDLKKLGLQLNIPPFLKDKVGFEEDDVIKTQTIARHRIHTERGICKVRMFQIFHSVIQFLCWDVSIKHGQWRAFCQIFKTLFLHDLIVSITTKLFFQVKNVF